MTTSTLHNGERKMAIVSKARVIGYRVSQRVAENRQRVEAAREREEREQRVIRELAQTSQQKEAMQQ
jgi:hypothetical protein